VVLLGLNAVTIRYYIFNLVFCGRLERLCIDYHGAIKILFVLHCIVMHMPEEYKLRFIYFFDLHKMCNCKDCVRTMFVHVSMF